MTQVVPPSMHNGLVSDEIRLQQFTHAAEKISTKKVQVMVKRPNNPQGNGWTLCRGKK